jgi:hypothetical protein
MVRRLGSGGALLVAWLCAGAWAVAQTPEEIFDRASTAYREERFEEAAEGFRALLAQRIRDPIVEYNLGNAEFRLGHLGQAILHYERAQRLDPLDSDVRANLEYARSLCFDRVEVHEPAPPVRWLRDVQDRIGPDRQAWLVLGVLWSLAALVAWCSSRPRGWSAAHGWVLSGLLLLFLVVTTSWYTTLRRVEGRRAGVVLEPAADVLAGPGQNNPTLFTVHEGLVLEVRSERDQWLQVSLPNGLNGWILRGTVGMI